MEQWLLEHSLNMGDLEAWNVRHDPTFNRIIAPAYSLTGRLCLAAVRNLDTEPRYDIQPKGCRVAYVLFGLNRTYKEIRDRSEVFVTEGFSDAIVLAKHGAPNVCATFTAGMSNIQLALLQNIADTIIVWGDGDDSGRAYAKKAASMSKQVMGLVVDGVDPPSLQAEHGSVSTILRIARGYHSAFSYIELGPDGLLTTAVERAIIE